MKKILSVFTVLALTALLIFSALAAEDKTVYVCDGGTGDGTSENSPLGSFQSAVNALNGKGGTIVLVGDTTRGGVTIPDQSGDLTVTAINDAKMIISGRTTMQKNINDNVYTFDMPIEVDATSGVSFEGRFNSVVFTENFTVECTKEGGSFSYYGGCLYPSDNESAVTELPYSITVNGGTFRRFEGGNIRSSGSIVGSIAAPLTVTVNGGTFGAVGEYDALAPNKTFNGFNFAGMNILADGGTLNINGGTFNVPIYVAGHLGQTGQGGAKNSTLTMSDKKYYAIDGDISVNITGGTFNGGAVAATYVEAGYTFLVRSNYTVNVEGGTFKEGTVFDATQVKAYTGEDKKATITIADAVENVSAKRFDIVNGESKTYDEPLRVAFIGDSITEGHSASDRVLTSYPARYLENALAAGEDVIVCNFGISSAGMQPGKNYYTPDMFSTTISLNECDADIFVFALGINDADYVGKSHGAFEEYYSRYKALIQAHGEKEDTDHVYVTSILPLTSSTPEKRLRAVSLVRPTQERIAKELDAEDPGKYTFIDLYSLLYDTIMADPTAFLKDGIHPNDYGYAVYGKTLYDAITNKVYKNEDFFMTDIYVSNNGEKFAKGTIDTPISALEYAVAKCAPNATIHIKDTLTFAGNIHTPQGLESFTIVGDIDGATLDLSRENDGLLLIAGSKIKLDNIFLTQAALVNSGKNSDLTFVGNYHDVEITESFTNQGTLRFYGGQAVYALLNPATLKTDTHFDTVETASASDDCTFTINGGTYTLLLGGNRLFGKTAPIGTYSGNMTLTVGEKVTVSNASYSGMNGMNYLTGTITATINGWGNIPIRDNINVDNMNINNYDISRNTGSVSVTVAEGITAKRCVTGDFDENGAFGFADALVALRHMLNNEPGNAETHYFGVKSIALRHILHMLKLCIN